jgi:hypothetical protein
MESPMYCNTCNCEYNGWSGICPSCKEPLQDEKPLIDGHENGHLDYSSLVELIEKEGAVFEIELMANKVTRSKSTRFPWLGFGYAWTQSMHGTTDGIAAELVTTELEKERKWSFPYRGHGYAWREEMQGWIAGNLCSLKATEVKRSRSWSFPYSGYGYAWTEEMQGTCGERIQVNFKASKVSRQKSYKFPYFGYGYAWVDKCTLTLSLV